MLCRPVVQAVTIERFGPYSPYMIDSCPEIMLMIEPGTKNGETRRKGRLSRNTGHFLGGANVRHLYSARTLNARFTQHFFVATSGHEVSHWR